MEQEKDDRFRRLMQEAGMEKPSPDFLKTVMSGIQAESQEEILLNPALKSLLRESQVVEKPNHDFLLRVMSQAQVQQVVLPPVSVAKPIISNRIWYIVTAACMAIICLTGLFYYHETGALETAVATTATDQFFTSVATGILATPLVYSVSLTTLGMLLLADYMLRSKFHLLKS